METDRISGKVAAVLNSRELALNVGSADGVTVGMRFAVLNSKGLGVTDPDTGEVLGDLPVAKTVVKVIRVDGPHLSTGRTFRTIPGKPGLADVLTRTSSFVGTPDRVETLRIDPSRQDVLEISEQDSVVKRGDTAVETRGDEFDEYTNR